jgi:flagellar export protein FliJ
VKKYKFRLDTVLRVRRTEQDLAKAELARANARVAEAVAMVDARLTHYASLPTAGSGATGSTAVFMASRFRQDTAAAAVVAAKVARMSALQDAEAYRMVWSQKATQVSVLDRLDERRRTEHELEAARQADIEVDDIVVGRFGRDNEGRL